MVWPGRAMPFASDHARLGGSAVQLAHPDGPGLAGPVTGEPRTTEIVTGICGEPSAVAEPVRPPGEPQ